MKFCSAVLCAAVLFASLASAQQPVATPSEQALGEKLLQEIQAGVQARAQLIDVQRQLAAAQAKITELEKKAGASAEPKK